MQPATAGGAVGRTKLRFLLLTVDDALAGAVQDDLHAAGHEAQWLRKPPSPGNLAAMPDAILADARAWPHHDGDLPSALRQLVALAPVLLVGPGRVAVPGVSEAQPDSDATGLAAHLVTLARQSSTGDTCCWADGELSIDFSHRTIRLAGVVVELTPIEWRVVARLASRPDSVVSRAEMSRLIAGEAGCASNNAVAVHLYNLRRKLGRHAIETIRGRGFRLRG